VRILFGRIGGHFVEHSHNFERFFKFVVLEKVEDGAEFALELSADKRLDSIFCVRYGIKSSVLDGVSAAKKTEIDICGAQVSGDFDSCNTDKSFDARVVEAVCNGVAYRFLYDTSHFFLSS
jgi:hypothetical protein